VVEDVGEVLGITTVCGSPSEMAGVGRSTHAGGDARRRRGVWPGHGEIEQLDGLERFTGCQRRCGCKELVGDSLDSLVHARRRKTEVR
jgi:bacterioferritin-associated ferredoxin